MRAWLLVFAALAGADLRAQSNIDPARAISSSPWLGPLTWRPFGQPGAVINPYFCSGFIYGANVGWIHLGSGSPANGVAYQNQSASDFGVNVHSTGDLRGFAYGANIGWIQFAPAGAPRIDWNTGQLSGAAWAANAGWIPLSDASSFVRVESLPDLPDSDGDGLPDAWEIAIAGTLAALSGDDDTDRDGQTNYQEYLAGTDPFDPGDFLRVLNLKLSASGGAEVEFPTKAGYTYRVEQRAGFGTGIWAPAPAPPLTGAGATASIRLPSNDARLYFYRVAAFPPLSALN